MHVAASAPEFLKNEDITMEKRQVALQVFEKEVLDKPENLREKILEGKLASYFKDKILLEQPFIKNPDLTIRQVIESAIQKFGEKIEVARFVRFKVGS